MDAATAQDKLATMTTRYLVCVQSRDAHPAPAPRKMAAPDPKILKTALLRPALPHPENAPSLTVTPLRPKDFTPCPAPPRNFYIK